MRKKILHALLALVVSFGLWLMSSLWKTPILKTRSTTFQWCWITNRFSMTGD